ncbi:hypothetical protein RBB68_08490 [Leptospira interrogans]|uniref:hypothetical protein n=1 Tax=Leptospira interrogans TaxID=173 RepID=UPI00280C37E0|nr:hypothetical protein [Leptospira interrogans]WML95889.1 hypothetical protein RBB68_08490 [Leptospira interrogans]
MFFLIAISRHSKRGHCAFFAMNIISAERASGELYPFEAEPKNGIVVVPTK